MEILCIKKLVFYKVVINSDLSILNKHSSQSSNIVDEVGTAINSLEL